MKTTSLFSGFITSKTRIKILMRLFLNPDQSAYLRELADEFKVSPSHIKDELTQLNKAELLTSRKNGRQILFSANQKHPVFSELQSMVKKSLGMDRILDSIITRLGNLEKAFVMDDYAEGKDTGIIDLVLVGDIDQVNLHDLVDKTEKYIERKIRPLVLNSIEFERLSDNFAGRAKFYLWECDADVGKDEG
ncbi:MAG: winged helix-turn-helix domain-containing protein [Desulfobulbaceae bacterium]|nr:winged helix-turn-helix domain-containing protein [Desulfobulbaceae bacterium]